MDLEIIRKTAKARWVNGQPAWPAEEWEAAQHPLMQKTDPVPEEYRGLEREGFAVPTKSVPVEKAPKTPEQQAAERNRAAYLRGKQEGHGQFWPWAKIPEEVTAPTPADAVEREERMNYLRGFSGAQQEDQHDITGFQAHFSHYLPDPAVKYWSSAAGQDRWNQQKLIALPWDGTIGFGNVSSLLWGPQYNVPNAPRYSKANDSAGYATDYMTEESAMLKDPTSSLSMALLANKASLIGRNPLLANLMDAQFYNDIEKQTAPDGSTTYQYNPSTYGQILQGLGAVEERAGREAVKSAPENAVLLGLGGPLVRGVGGVLAKVPGAAKATAAVTNFVTKNPYVTKATEFFTKHPDLAAHAKSMANASGITAAVMAPDLAADMMPGRDASLALDTDKGKLNEKQLRATYGNDIADEVIQSTFRLHGEDENGNYVEFNPPVNATKDQLESTLQSYQAYTNWMKEAGIPEDKINDEDTKFQFCMAAAQGGTSGTDLFETGMFRTLSPEHAVDIGEAWLAGAEARAQGDWKSRGMSLWEDLKGGKNIFKKTKGAWLAEAMQNDDSGVFADGLTKFFTYAPVEAGTIFLDRHSSGTGGGPYDTDIVYDTIGKAMENAVRADHHKLLPNLQGIVKLSAAKAERDGKVPDAASKGVQMLKNTYGNLLSDPDIYEDLSAEEKKGVISLMSKICSTKEGQAMLGKEGNELAGKIVENLQGVAGELALTHPEMWPALLGAWFTFKGMPKVGEAVENPFVFWSGVGTILLGGALAVSSVFDSDEDDEEDENDSDDYGKAIRSAVARVTDKV